MVQGILYMTQEELDQNTIIRQIIDAAFSYVRIVTMARMWFYIIFFAFPMLAQMFFSDVLGGFWVIVFCLSALSVQVILFLFELIEMKVSSFRTYLRDPWNVLDMSAFGLTMIYTILRFTNQNSFLPVEDRAQKHFDYYKTDEYTYYLFGFMPILNVAIIWCTFMQLLHYLKSDPNMGSLVTLVTYCINALWTFLSFLILFMFLFAFTFKMLGATFDEETYDKDYNDDLNDYKYVPDLWVFLIQTFRNSIGDLGTPHYKYWVKRYDLGVTRKGTVEGYSEHEGE